MERLPDDFLPTWMGAAGAESAFPEEHGVVSMRRYLRTMVEWLWCVYRDDRAERGLPVPLLDTRILRAYGIAELRHAIAELSRVVGWARGYPRTALDLAVRELSHLPLDSLGVAEAYPPIVRGTFRDLYPLVLQYRRFAGDASWPTDLEVHRYDGPRRADVLIDVPHQPPSAPFFSVKPSMRWRRPLKQPRWTTAAKPLHMYDAYTFAEPRANTIVLVEGVSDAAVVEQLLDSVDKAWRGLGIRVVDGGGDNLPGRYERLSRDADAVVTVCDLDRIHLSAWVDVFNGAYAFVISPDLNVLISPASAERSFSTLASLSRWAGCQSYVIPPLARRCPRRARTVSLRLLSRNWISVAA